MRCCFLRRARASCFLELRSDERCIVEMPSAIVKATARVQPSDGPSDEQLSPSARDATERGPAAPSGDERGPAARGRLRKEGCRNAGRPIWIASGKIPHERDGQQHL